MPTDLNLVLRLTADSKGFVGEVRVSKEELDKLTGAENKATQAANRQTQSTNKLTAGISRAGRAQREQAAAAREQARAQARATTAAQRAARANRWVASAATEAHRWTVRYAGSVLGLHQVLRALGATRVAADSYTELSNRLRLVTRSEAGLVAVRRELLATSQATRTELAANAQLYSRIALSADATGHSQAQLLRVTELLNKQVLIGGNNASEAAAGLVQFAQGLASGRLQGDELRSVLENLQGVSQGLIAGFRLLRERGRIDFDVTRGNIRELAAEGVLSAELLLDSILASGTETERKFEQVAITMAGGLQRVRNTALQLVGELDAVIGVSAQVGAGLSAVAVRLDEVDAEAFADDLRNIGTVALLIASVMGGRLAVAAGRYARGQLRASAATGAFSRQARIGAARAALLAARQHVGAAAASRHARAILRAGAAARVLGRSLAILGGPAGIAALAAYGLYEFATATRAVNDDLTDLPDQIDDLRASLIGLSQAELSRTASRLAVDITRVRNEIEQARTEAAGLEDLTRAVALSGSDPNFLYLQSQQANERAAEGQTRLNTLLRQEAEIRRQISNLNRPSEEAAARARTTEAHAQRALQLRADLLTESEKINQTYRDRITLLDEEAQADAAALATLARRMDAEKERLGRVAGLSIAGAPAGASVAGLEREKAEIAKREAERTALLEKIEQDRAARLAAIRRRAHREDEALFPDLLAMAEEAKFTRLFGAGAFASAAQDELAALTARNEQLRRVTDFSTEAIRKQAEQTRIATDVRNHYKDATEATIQALIRARTAEADLLQQQQLKSEVLQQYAAHQTDQADRQRAINDLYATGQLSLTDYHAALAQLRIETGDGTIADGFIVQLERMEEASARSAANIGTEFATLIGPGGQLEAGFARSAARAVVFGESFKKSIGNVAREAVASLLQSFIQLAIQTLITQRIVNLFNRRGATANIKRVAGQAVSSAAQAAQHAYQATAIIPIIGPVLAPAAAAQAFAASSALGAVALTGATAAAQYARGGIVDSPTFFSARNVPHGLAGEAGPEAIVPLRRLADGRLGIGQARDRAGAPRPIQLAVTITINGNATPDTVDLIDRRLTRCLPVLIRRGIADEQRPGGLLNRTDRVG